MVRWGICDREWRVNVCWRRREDRWRDSERKKKLGEEIKTCSGDRRIKIREISM